jgi:hypothetical protein
MTNSPANMLAVRAEFRARTGLPAVALGIQHYSPQGGGYHEGNDLLAAAGRLNSDYSKRETEADRPGSDDASGIDIGWFDVTLPNGRRVTLRDLSRWTLANWNAADAQWIREMIYSLDGKIVKRADRLGKRSSGDGTHTSHNHYSKFRDDESDAPVRFFRRFWTEMAGGVALPSQQGGTYTMADVPQQQWADVAFTIAGAPNGPAHVRDALILGEAQAANVKLSTLLQEAAEDKARDQGLRVLVEGLVAAITAGGGSIDAAPILARINEIAAAESAAVATLTAKLDQQTGLVAELQAEVDMLRGMLARAGGALAGGGAPAVEGG